MDLITGISNARRTDRERGGIQSCIARSIHHPHRTGEENFKADCLELIPKVQPLPYVQPPSQLYDDEFLQLHKLCTLAYEQVLQRCPEENWSVFLSRKVGKTLAL